MRDTHTGRGHAVVGPRLRTVSLGAHGLRVSSIQSLPLQAAHVAAGGILGLDSAMPHCQGLITNKQAQAKRSTRHGTLLSSYGPNERYRSGP